MSERRKLDRMPVQWPVRYRRIRPDGGLDVASPTQQTIDVTSRGIAFSTTEAIPKGHILLLVVDAQWGPTPMVVIGRVTWCRLEESGYQVGVRSLWTGWDVDEALDMLTHERIQTKLQDQPE